MTDAERSEMSFTGFDSAIRKPGGSAMWNEDGFPANEHSTLVLHGFLRNPRTNPMRFQVCYRYEEIQQLTRPWVTGWTAMSRRQISLPIRTQAIAYRPR